MPPLLVRLQRAHARRQQGPHLQAIHLPQAQARAAAAAAAAKRSGTSTFSKDRCPHCEGRQCCLGRVRSLDDFQEDRLEESTLSRMTKAAGFTFWFLPKFHSELSAIERWWAVLKYYVRRCHDYAESLRACILLAVKDFCGEDVIRRAFNTTFRFGTCTM